MTSSEIDERLDKVIINIEDQLAEMQARFGDRWLKMRTPEGGYLAAPLLTALANALTARSNRSRTES